MLLAAYFGKKCQNGNCVVVLQKVVETNPIKRSLKDNVYHSTTLATWVQHNISILVCATVTDDFAWYEESVH